MLPMMEWQVMQQALAIKWFMWSQRLLLAGAVITLLTMQYATFANR